MKPAVAKTSISLWSAVTLAVCFPMIGSAAASGNWTMGAIQLSSSSGITVLGITHDGQLLLSADSILAKSINSSGVRGQHGSGVRGQHGSGVRGQHGSGVRGQHGSGVRGQHGSGVR